MAQYRADYARVGHDQHGVTPDSIRELAPGREDALAERIWIFRAPRPMPERIPVKISQCRRIAASQFGWRLAFPYPETHLLQTLILDHRCPAATSPVKREFPAAA